MASGRKRRRRNIIFCFICYDDWPAGPQKRSFSSVYRWIFDNHQSLCARCRNFSECKLQKTLDSIQAMDTTRGRWDGPPLPQFLISGQRYKGRCAGSRFTMAQNSGKGRDHRMFAVTFQIKSVLKHPHQWHHVNNPNIQRSSRDIVLLKDSKRSSNSFQVLPCVEKNQFLW